MTPGPEQPAPPSVLRMAAPLVVSFWMRGTEVALDLAYLDESMRIVDVLAMTPFDETPRPSSVPVSFALEVRAGTLADLGLGVGDLLTTE